MAPMLRTPIQSRLRSANSQLTQKSSSIEMAEQTYSSSIHSNTEGKENKPMVKRCTRSMDSIIEKSKQPTISKINKPKQPSVTTPTMSSVSPNSTQMISIQRTLDRFESELQNITQSNMKFQSECQQRFEQMNNQFNEKCKQFNEFLNDFSSKSTEKNIKRDVPPMSWYQCMENTT